MPEVVRPPLTQAQRIRRLNGVVGHFSHPAILSTLANSLHGRCMRGTYTIPISAKITNLSQVKIPIPMWGDANAAKLDVLAYATDDDSYDLTFVSDADATGVTITVANYTGAATSMAAAEWFTTGWHEGDTTSQEQRRIVLTAGGDGNGFETLTYTGNVKVDVYAMRLTYLRVPTL